MDFTDKIEGAIDKHAGKIGAGLAALAGIGKGYEACSVYGENAAHNYWTTIVGGKLADGRNRNAEIMHLMNFDMKTPDNIIWYLKYKFGLTRNTDGSLSAWATPFWASLIAYITSQLNILPSRYNKPLGNISKAALIVSVIGALALPGSGAGPKTSDSNPPQNNIVDMAPNRNGVYQVIGGAF